MTIGHSHILHSAQVGVTQHKEACTIAPQNLKVSSRRAAVHLLEHTWSTLQLWCVGERLGACHVCVNVAVCVRVAACV